MATVSSQIPPGFGPDTLRGSAGRRRKEAAVRWGLLAAAATSAVISVAIVATLVVDAGTFLSNINLDWLLVDGWFPRANDFGIPTLVVGTLIIVGIAMVVAVPLGLGAAMYLSEYASPRTRRVLKPILEVLASIPSVVLGYFALQTINPYFVQVLFGSAGTFNLMAAGIAVGVLIVPLVASVAEDAMHAVPSALREAAFGIGARRRTVTTRIVFPAAISGITAAVILGMARAVGETMVIAIAAGATGGAPFTVDPLERGQTMTGAIASLAIGSDQVRGADQAFNSLYFVGLLLFAFTLALTFVSDRFVRRYRRVY